MVIALVNVNDLRRDKEAFNTEFDRGMKDFEDRQEASVHQVSAAAVCMLLPHDSNLTWGHPLVHMQELHQEWRGHPPVLQVSMPDWLFLQEGYHQDGH